MTLNAKGIERSRARAIARNKILPHPHNATGSVSWEFRVELFTIAFTNFARPGGRQRRCFKVLGSEAESDWH
jgi:hypothetical protein